MAMLKSGSPLIQGIIDDAMADGRREAARDDIITVLAARFGPEAEALRAALKKVGDAGLKELLVLAATSPDLDSFREQVKARKRKRRS